MIKPLQLSASIMALVLVASPIAYAETTTDAANTQTGSHSDNSVSTSVSSSTSIENTNNATINNDFSIKANTGGNSASNNTGDATIETGDVVGNIDISNTGNVNSTSDPAANSVTTITTSSNGTSDITISASNSNTGSNSDNYVSTHISNRNDYSNSNYANVHNNINAYFNTGDNKAGDNTGSAKITTGDIKVNVAVENCLNFNFVNSDNKKLDLCVPTVEKPAGAVAEPVPFVQESAPVTTTVLAANPVAAQEEGEVLGVNVLPATGSQVNFNILLTVTVLLVSLGLVIRQKAKSKLEYLAFNTGAARKLNLAL